MDDYEFKRLRAFVGLKLKEKDLDEDSLLFWQAINQLCAELEEWRSVFGHLGKSPDDCGNAVYKQLEELRKNKTT